MGLFLTGVGHVEVSVCSVSHVSHHNHVYHGLTSDDSMLASPPDSLDVDEVGEVPDLRAIRKGRHKGQLELSIPSASSFRA